jgi:hypothetical protein
VPPLLAGEAQRLGPGEVAIYKPRWGAFYRIVVVRDAISGLYDRGAEELAGIGVRLIDADELAAAVHAGVS